MRKIEISKHELGECSTALFRLIEVLGKLIPYKKYEDPMTNHTIYELGDKPCLKK